ncbi:response regulator transcription factor [Paraburkholderia tropica]|uniref:response regulator transcription factor n=1 Tax=Paraburkholderia tropica TaxID=92647 RepID=UPI001CC551E2|nr:response regulator [Paraburkholderia tropica]
MCTPTVIWVVDDDASVRSGLSSLLRSLDYEVVTFESGAELLSAVVRARPACIISDVQMPGMSGVDMFARLIDAKLAIPTLFITAYPMPELHQRALALGASAFLIKPVSVDDLTAAVNAALAS